MHCAAPPVRRARWATPSPPASPARRRRRRSGRARPAPRPAPGSGGAVHAVDRHGLAVAGGERHLDEPTPRRPTAPGAISQSADANASSLRSIGSGPRRRRSRTALTPTQAGRPSSPKPPSASEPARPRVVDRRLGARRRRRHPTRWAAPGPRVVDRRLGLVVIVVTRSAGRAAGPRVVGRDVGLVVLVEVEVHGVRVVRRAGARVGISRRRSPRRRRRRSCRWRGTG